MADQPGNPSSAESQRAQKSGSVGYSADTDDWLYVTEHEEQRIDPNREVSGSRRGGGGGMPMMPMMPGGGGAGAGGVGMAGAGTAGVGATGMGAGAAGLGAAGLGGRAGLAGAAVGAGAYGAGTSAAGSGYDGGIDTDGDGIDDTFATGSPGSAGWGGGSSTARTNPSWGTGSSDWQPGYRRPGTTDWQPNTRGGGDVSVDPGTLTDVGSGWSGVSDEMSQLASMAQLAQSNPERLFGFVTPPSGEYQALQTDVNTWSANAQKTFTEMASKLAANAASYRDLQSSQIASASTINGGS